MSILQVANVWFDSTGNNRIHWTDTSAVAVVIAGANAVTVNSSSMTVTQPSSFSSIIANTITSNTIIDIIGNVRTLPTNPQSSVYTTIASDSGKIINTSANITVNGAIFSNGQAFSVYNNSASNISIISGTGVTVYLGGSATTGTRTLAQKGIATLAMVDSNTFVISGAGLS